MLTLKVITTDQDGQNETYIFNAETISHKEFDKPEGDETDYPKQANSDSEIYIDTFGGVVNTSQPFSYSRVFFYNDGPTPEKLLWIMPCAICYIMQDGKTVDTFSARFK